MKYLKNKRNDQLTQKPDILKGKLEKYILINLCKKNPKRQNTNRQSSRDKTGAITTNMRKIKRTLKQYIHLLSGTGHN